jgi:hypothetical protein
MTATTTSKPARQLQPGDHIHGEGVNWLKVISVLGSVFDSSLYNEDYTEVDVAPQLGADIWDAGVLAAATGADSAQWLSGTNHTNLRYRLYYRPNADVQVKP